MSRVDKRLSAKVKRSLGVLERHCGGGLVSSAPTRTLYVGNGGSVCGLDTDQLLAAFARFGLVQDIFAWPNKPFVFIRYEDAESAGRALEAMQGSTLSTAQVVAPPVLYLAFVLKIPQETADSNSELPAGLELIPEFITLEEEQQLWELASSRLGKGCPPTLIRSHTTRPGDARLRHRSVLHFGYNWDYGRSRIDADGPRPPGIPDVVAELLGRRSGLATTDQCTVNVYEAGAGIPAHTDTHSTCEEPIASLSLLAPLLMAFTHPPSKRKVDVLLPPRSLLVLTGEARYVWTHAILPRKYDFLPCGRVLRRQLRCSYTFRTLRRKPCECLFPDFCDRGSFGSSGDDPAAAAEVETKYVAEVYESIAAHFDATRQKEWGGVRRFLDAQPPDAVLLDVGCGNGKYLAPTPGLLKIGCDLSLNLCEIARRKGAETLGASCLTLPLRNESVDVAISIAVIHHLASEERRRRAVEEILRVLRRDGSALLYVWAFEQKRSGEASKYLTGKVSPNLSEEHAPSVTEQASLSTGHLEIHVNRTQFKQQDLLVPWDKQGSSGEEERLLRFYHVFREGELESLVQGLPCDILETWYEQGNWAVVLRKQSLTSTSE